MKKHSLIVLITAFAIVAINGIAQAQATLIHYWHFNSYSMGTMYTPTITPVPADYSDLAGSNARVLYRTIPGTSAMYSSFMEGFTSLSTDYDTVNLRMSQPAGDYLRMRNPSDSMELLFYTSSTHFSNLKLTFGTSRPTNGMKYQQYDYSIDSGVNWITTGLSLLTDSVWSTFQRITLTTTNTAANNNSKLVFRITWMGNVTGTMGNNRFDNISLDGDTITTTASHQLVAASADYALFPNPAINTLDITTPFEGRKHIVITNLPGQRVYEAFDERKQFPVSTAQLTPGCYFLHVTEEGTGHTKVMKFEKL